MTVYNARLALVYFLLLGISYAAFKLFYGKSG